MPRNCQKVLMHVLDTRCAVLDVHKDTIVACVRCVWPPMHQAVRNFGTSAARPQNGLRPKAARKRFLT